MGNPTKTKDKTVRNFTILPRVLRHKNIGIKRVTPNQQKKLPDKIITAFPGISDLPLVYLKSIPKDVSYAITNVGIVLSGGPAPGGHDVIAGILHGVKSFNTKNEVYGFIGGDDSNTNACFLAEYFHSTNSGIIVIGVPKTIDGDLKNEFIEISFGFDTATKVYSNLIGNISRDAVSSLKYWHFIKIMGRSASHVTLECALKVQPNLALISEEIGDKQCTLEEVAVKIATIIRDRAELGKNYGVLLIPEGLLENIPETNELINCLNSLLKNRKSCINDNASGEADLKRISEEIPSHLKRVFHLFPGAIIDQLTGKKDSYGNMQVSSIETEKLLATIAGNILQKWKQSGEYKGEYTFQTHFLGYEGRCAAPSYFDSNYSYVLGYTSSVLAVNRLNGYLARVSNLTAPIKDWVPGGVPLCSMLGMEQREGKKKWLSVNHW